MVYIDCYQCSNVCPFNKKPGIGHYLIRWFVRKKATLPALNRRTGLGNA
jgi:heterodisulfide reductase subunit C